MFETSISKLIGGAGVVTAGTVGGLLAFLDNPADCVHVPYNMLATSEAAFAAVNADTLRLDGYLAFHHAYNPETGETGLHHKVASIVALGDYGPLSASDLDETDARHMLIHKPGASHDGLIMDWRLWQEAGWKIISTSEDLPKC